MNRKGFTLVELLAVVVILGLVMGIAAYGVGNTIANSKKRSEAIFVNKIGDLIDDYLVLNGSSLYGSGSEYCAKNCSDSDPIYAKRVTSSTVTLRSLVNAKLVDEQKFVNPVNKNRCLDNGKNPSVVIYKDTQYVFYYYVDLSGSNTSCSVSDDNAIVGNMPLDLVKSLKNAGVSLPQNLLKKVGLS